MSEEQINDRGPGVATGGQQAESPSAPPVIVRRGHAATRLVPRVEPPRVEGIVVQRSIFTRRSSDKPQTSRQRQVAGDLPDWEPLPPGELVVRRGRST